MSEHGFLITIDGKTYVRQGIKAHLAQGEQGTVLVLPVKFNPNHGEDGRFASGGSGGGTGIFASLEMADDWASDQSQSWRDGLSKSEFDAVRSYQSFGYHNMNGSLRSGDKIEIRNNQKDITALDSALSKARIDRDVETYRHFTGRGAEALTGRGDKIVGTEILDRGFTSTSLSKKYVDKWAGYAEDEGRSVVVAKILVPKGTKAGYIRPFLTSMEEEYEFVLPRGSRFLISAVGKDAAGRTEVSMEMLND